jgi:hypothetical protein
VVVTVDAAPIARIVRRGDTLIASEGASYQWLRDGKVIRDATSRTLVVKRSGSYRVVVGNAQGCSSASDAQPIRSGAWLAPLNKWRRDFSPDTIARCDVMDVNGLHAM